MTERLDLFTLEAVDQIAVGARSGRIPLAYQAGWDDDLEADVVVGVSKWETKQVEPTGWQCPKCSRCYAPTTPACQACNDAVMVAKAFSFPETPASTHGKETDDHTADIWRAISSAPPDNTA